MKLIDLRGKRFGRLTVRKIQRIPFAREVSWLCECDCGRTKVILGGSLRSGYTTSCGCLHKEIASRKHLIHGHARKKLNSPIYGSWCGMISRCTNPRNKQWDNYGGRGITVCRRWYKFKNFLADMGEAPPGLSLDRINNDGNYEPGNCRWATAKQQANNRRLRKDAKLTRANVRRALTLLANGCKIALVARRFGVGEAVLRHHRKRGEVR